MIHRFVLWLLGRWRLRGWDVLSGHPYPIPGRFRSRRAAERAARRQLRRLGRIQPPDRSGGQEGIQDQVFVVRPDGSAYRYPPDPAEERPI